jgi:hypothetical protein
MNKIYATLFVFGIVALVIGSVAFAISDSSQEVPETQSDKQESLIEKTASCGVSSCATSGCTQCGKGLDDGCGCGCRK